MAEVDIDELAKQVLLEKREPVIDDDGYDPKDPYADAAREIDRQRKRIEEKKKAGSTVAGKAAKVAKTIIENKETVTQWEKIIKSALAILGLVYLTINSGVLDKDDVSWLPDSEILSAFTNHTVIKDFMAREGLILIVVVGGFIWASRYNAYLDGLERE